MTDLGLLVDAAHGATGPGDRGRTVRGSPEPPAQGSNIVASTVARGGGATIKGDAVRMEPVKTRCVATWWEDKPEADLDTFVPATEEVEIEVHWDGDAFFIDGLRDGQYLSIPLYGIAKSMADGAAPAKGLAR